MPRWFTRYTQGIISVLMMCLSFMQSSTSVAQTVQAWGDAPPAAWTASTLNNARSDYFQGEVIPFVYKFPSAGLVTGSSYTFNIRYDYYRSSGNAGGYAYMTTYNVSRDPDESAIGPNPTLDNTATAANVGNFYTVNADITSAVFLADNVSGSTTGKVVQVTFTFTGTPGNDIIVYFGMFLAKTGSVPDQGLGVTEGAAHWPGGSLMVIITGTGGGGNVGNNPGAGGVVEGVISGVKYRDDNQSGSKDGSESGLAGWTIYLDLNNSNTFDGGDVSATTAGDGSYSFGDLLPGTFTVREVNQNGWTQTQPGGPDFEYSISIDAANFSYPNKNFGNYECPTNGGTAAAALSPICAGSATTISLSGQAGNIVKWQYSTDGSTWNDIASTANPLNTGVLAVTTQFRAVVQSGACASQNSSAATVVVDAATVGGSAAAGLSPICAGSGTTVNLTGNTGAIVKWQYSTDGSTWNDIASTANPLNTGVLVVATQFRAVVQNGACSSDNSSAATVVVDAATVGGSAAAALSPICAGSSTTVSLTGNTGSIVKWQYSTDGSTWNDIASTANPLNTGVLVVTTQFRAVVQNGACSSDNSSAATVVVDAATVGGSAAAALSPICAGSSTTISLTGNTGAIVKWQYSTDGSTWNDIASTANPLNTGVLMVTTQFRAVVQNGACSSGNSSAATVVVDAATVGGSAAAAVSPICAGSSTTVNLTGNTGAIVKWQYSTDGSTWNDIASTANPLNTGVLLVTTQFRAVVQNGTCSSQNSSAATVVVDGATVGGSASAALSPICAGSGTSVSLTGNTGAIVKWQYSIDGSTWNDIASTANPLNTGVLLVTTQFRAVVQNGACSSQNSSAATVAVDATTVGGSAAAALSPICSGSGTTVSLSGNTGAIVKWQYSTDGSTWNDIASTANPLNTGVLTTTTQFRAVVQNGACSTQNSSAATVVVTPPIIVTFFTGDVTVTYPNNAVFSVTASNVTGYQWQEKTSAPGSLFLNLLSETGNSITLTSPPVSKSGYQYKVNLSSNSPCPGDFRMGTLTVNPASLCLSYDGLTFGVTNTNGCYVNNTGYGTGVIRLILSVVGSPAGDLSTAVVKVNIAGVLSNATCTFVPAQGGNPAYYYYDWSVPCLGNNVNSTTHELTWTIGGNYSTGTCNETNALITISRPSLDFTTGGGYILNNKSKGQIGIAPGETPSKNNYGFNVKWSNNFKNLQGNFNTIIRQGTKQYQVKTNKPTYLVTNALAPYTLDNKTYYPYEAIMVFENAVFKDLTLGTSQGGGPTSIVYLRVVDNGEPNTAGTQRIDSISIFYKLNNTVIYSSENYTVTNNPALIKLKEIEKGNIQVHVNGGPNGTNQMIVQSPVMELAPQPAQLFELKAMPNPAISSFNVRVTSDNRNVKMQLRVMDINGKIVQQVDNVTPGATLNLGANYRPGVYTIEVMQGNRVKQMKVVKM